MIAAESFNFGNGDTITTSEQPASTTIGSSIADEATVTGLVSPSGSETVTFNLYNWAGTLLVSDADVPLAINGSSGTATSPGYIPTATGTDYWVATYNGDANNAIVSSGATARAGDLVPTDIVSAPEVVTVAGGTVVLGSGGTLTDSATLQGLVGDNLVPGTITFYLFAGGHPYSQRQQSRLQQRRFQRHGDGQHHGQRQQRQLRRKHVQRICADRRGDLRMGGRI